MSLRGPLEDTTAGRFGHGLGDALAHGQRPVLRDARASSATLGFEGPPLHRVMPRLKSREGTAGQSIMAAPQFTAHAEGLAVVPLRPYRPLLAPCPRRL